MQKKGSRQKLAYVLIGVLLLSVIFVAVSRFFSKNGPRPATKPTAVEQPKPNVPQIAIPDFSADSALLYVKKQVDFGPRVPNTPAHQKCAAWFVKEFKRHGLTVIEQPFEAKHYKGTTFKSVNIIAQYKPEATKRILLAAHWDSRFQADKDTRDKNRPIDGADDGASGVGVLLEIARTLRANPMDVGVDFILFDAEDQGDDDGDEATWCLGSQYWAANLHQPGYSPYYAVLLDMVGAKGARFFKEGISMQVAPETVNKIWGLADKLGYKEYFVAATGPGITDDHKFVIQGARIPMIDIISTPNVTGEQVFGSYHHTHADNFSLIDKATLKAVGQTMTAFLYMNHNQTI
jgi:hypothetical protein